LPSAPLALKKHLSAVVWAIIALIAVIGLTSCGGGDYGTALRAPATVRTDLGAENETPGIFSRLEAAQIRYSQSTYSIRGETDEGDLYTVEENVQWLRDHPDQELPWGEPIRVFRKQAFMDEWGPLTQIGFTGDPKNLDNGEIYTLDHRRLVANRLAGRKTVPVQWASLSVVRDNRWKFTTSNRDAASHRTRDLNTQHCAAIH